MITRSATTETELGGLIDGVNALIIQLYQTLIMRDAGSTADVNTDDTVLPGGGDVPSGGGSGGSSGDGSSGGGSPEME